MPLNTVFGICVPTSVFPFLILNDRVNYQSPTVEVLQRNGEIKFQVSRKDKTKRLVLKWWFGDIGCHRLQFYKWIFFFF